MSARPDPRRSVCPIAKAPDLVTARAAVKQLAEAAGLGVVAVTRVVTAASELARNALDHAGGGTLTAEIVTSARGGRTGLRLTVEDRGPGIPDLERALTDGFTTRSGLGLGLGGARRLVDEFAIESEVGRGTVVVVTQWR